jgi:hypothetical protein
MICVHMVMIVGVGSDAISSLGFISKWKRESQLKIDKCNRSGVLLISVASKLVPPCPARDWIGLAVHYYSWGKLMHLKQCLSWLCILLKETTSLLCSAGLFLSMSLTVHIKETRLHTSAAYVLDRRESLEGNLLHSEVKIISRLELSVRFASCYCSDVITYI